MEADGLSGGTAPLMFELGFRRMWVDRPSALATILSDQMLWFLMELEALWSLEVFWMF